MPGLLTAATTPVLAWPGAGRIGLWLLIGYAATMPVRPEIGEGFKLAVLLMGFGGFFWLAGARRFGPPVWLLLAATLVALLSWGLALWHHPHWAESSPRVHRLTHWFSFLAVAWLLAGRERRVLVLWGAAVLGLLSAPWLVGRGWVDWFDGVRGERIDFGLHNAQHATLLFATALLGLTALAPRLLGPGAGRLWRVLSWTLVTGACALAVVITQTRGVWLGLAAAGLVLLAGACQGLRRRIPSAPRRWALTVVLAGGVLALVAAAALSPIVEQRLAEEHQTMTRLARGELEGATGSVAGRVLSWSAARPWIAERPVLGWGGNGRGLVLAHSPQLPAWIEEEGFRHLHSGYLDTLVNFGLAGLAVLAGLVVWITRQALAAQRHGVLPADFLLFYLAFMMFWLVVNLFESFLFFSSGDWVFTLVVGGVTSFGLASGSRAPVSGAAGSGRRPATAGARPANAAGRAPRQAPGRRTER